MYNSFRNVAVLAALFLFTASTQTFSGTAYLERFTNFQQWSQNLPENPDNEFYTFIESEGALAKKLRERWLYQLIRKKNWSEYSRYYKPTQDPNLQCYDSLANFYQGNTEQAFSAAKPLWLTGESQTPACNQLFNVMIKQDNFDENLITERIVLALEKRNIQLARYLLKQYKQPHLQDEKLLVSIYERPSRITQLQPGFLHGEFYLYGLKRLITTNMDQAIKLAASKQGKTLLSDSQQQAFLAQVALYKAMRNHEDAMEWFAKVKPAYYSDLLLDWQIRFALKRQQWKNVEKLINQYPDPKSPCWQYWLARAKEANGNSAQAHEIYLLLAENRNYYGFLSSLRLNKKPTFQNENPVNNMAILKPYQPFTDNIKLLYTNNQELQASRLLNDFVSELPKEDKSALIYWLGNALQWHGKSVYLSNNEELNNQLALRFPLAYKDSVNAFAKNYSLPQALIYAIIRQESGFRVDVMSPVGARGLMQVMPATAIQVTKSQKIAYSDKDQLFSSQKNINIGVAYLKYLAKHFREHPLLMAAAYNAGPRQVNYWLKNHPPKQIDIWIETLPWHETRNYLKNVISFYIVYQYRMNTKQDLNAFMKPFT